MADGADINTEIFACEDALRVTPDDHPDKPRFLSNLGSSLFTRFERFGNIGDIERAVSAHKDSVRLTPDAHPQRPLCLSNLGNSILSRFERLGYVADIDMAISVHEDAVQLTANGHPSKPRRMSNLSTSLFTRFKRFGDAADVERAIFILEDALRLTPEGHPERPVFLLNQGSCVFRRFKRFGDIVDIDRAISTEEDALRLTTDKHPDRSMILSNLGVSFFGRFERLRNVADIDKAIAAHEAATQLLPEGHPNKLVYLLNQGNSFTRRFEHLGDIADLDRAISAHEEVVRLTPDDHAEKASRLSNLASSMLARFERLGDITDIDRVVSVLEDSVRLTPDSHPNKSNRLSNQGSSFTRRFEQLGDIADIDKAISALEHAVRLTPVGHPDRPVFLLNEGNSFTRRFELHGDMADIDRAISAHDDAVQLTPDRHPDKPLYLSNQGASLRIRFECSGGTTDIDRAISAHEDAIRLTPDNHPLKPRFLFSQGNSSLTHYRQFRNIADIDMAISAHADAVRLTPDDHPHKPLYLFHLGISLLTRFEGFGDIADIDKAILQFDHAAGSLTGPPIVRFNASLQWAQCAVTIGASQLKAYGSALDLLPRVAWLGLTVADRHEQLAKIGDVVRDAAAAAIELGEYGTALEWVEQGRSIVWGQVLNLRSPVDHLRVANSALAERLHQVSKELETATFQSTAIEQTHQLSMEQIAQNHRRLASEWDSLVEQARALPGFEDFLRSRKLSQLRKAAQDGPVVVINVHKLRCDALVIMEDLDGVIHIPLDSLSYDQAVELQSSLDTILLDSGLRARTSDRTMIRVRGDRSPEKMFRNILSRLWRHVVKPVLDGLAIPVSQHVDPPRIWWCPTGPLAFLPLHAAGIYENDEPGYRIWDFVASSYTPTLSALLEASHITTVGELKLLAIAQPATPGQCPIPNTTEELAKIRRHATDIHVESLEGIEATVDRVIQSMKECSWIHLACHGTQDADNPTKSALLLQDDRLELSQIVQTPLPHADFAFLSACQTAAGNKRLSEEAVHLAAGMLLAGFRGVIATTWSIKDNDAPFVADEVYGYLFKDRRRDRKRAAHALHHAVQKLCKEKGVPFLSWVPFIHVGM